MSEKRILFIGDLHYHGENPPMRIDNCREEMQDLILQSLHMAEDKKCEAAVFLGDLFNHYEPGGSIRNEMIDLLSLNPDTGLPWYTKRYAVVGNHDLPGNNIQGLYRSAMGTLSRVGVQVQESIDDLSIFCGHYSYDIHQKDFSGRHEQIYALHAYILPDDLTLFQEDYYVPISRFKVGPACRLVITGHYHDGYGIVKRDDGVIFCCPGALSRREASKSNMTRDIQVALVTISDTDIDVSLEPLVFSPGDKIFDMQKVARHKAESHVDRSELARKLDEMRKLNVSEITANPRKDFEDFAATMGLSRKGVSKVLEVLEEVKSEKKK